jgi:low affinity Fe/Cu permease
MSEHKPGWFTQFASTVAKASGKPATFVVAALGIVIWAAIGPFVGYSDFWQLTVNTGTTIITFLMVFLIQNTQNRDTAALHIKIDELICATKEARNSIMDLTDMSDEELERLQKNIQLRAKQQDQEELEASADEQADKKPAPAKRRPAKAAGKKSAPKKTADAA